MCLYGDGGAVLSGGCGRNGDNADLWHLDFAKGEWRKVQAAHAPGGSGAGEGPTGRSGHSLFFSAALDGYTVWQYGGCAEDGRLLGDCWEMRPGGGGEGGGGGGGTGGLAGWARSFSWGRRQVNAALPAERPGTAL